MRYSSAKELFRFITATYFAGASVVFNNQRGAAKSPLGIVSISAGQVSRPYMPNVTDADGEIVGNYQSKMSIVVDLFTHGKPVYHNGKVVGYDNTAVEDMLAFADYLDSEFVTDWCDVNDIAILIDGDVQDLTNVVNDTSFDYRSRLTISLYYTHKAVGNSAVLLEESILYPVYKVDPDTGEIVLDEHGNPILEIDPVTGEPLYTATPPVETVSRTNGWLTNAQITEFGKIIKPVFAQTSTGGGSDELAENETGYFTKVDEIKEEEF